MNRSIRRSFAPAIALGLVASLAPLGLSACAVSQSAQKKRAPNVVVIFIDDLGYADIGSFGAKGYSTPHLDRMAREGRRFTDFYVTQAVCSASRASLLTGCYSNRVGILGALGPGAKHGIHADETTIAELCKERGYATACYGKWHLGHHRQFLPMQHGFDDYYGLPYSNDMWPWHPGIRHLPMAEKIKRWPHLPLIDKNEIVEKEVTPEIQKTLTTEYTRRAVDFIKTNKDRPFFLYVPHSMVHVPLFVSERFAGKSGAGLFGDVMMEVDWSVGRILDTLRELEIDDDTLVVFTSDNGPWLSYGDHAGSALPLREGKGTMWDGGCRVPTIFWWPGKIPAGTTCKTPAMTIDLLPTIARLIGAKAPPHADAKRAEPNTPNTRNAGKTAARVGGAQDTVGSRDTRNTHAAKRPIDGKDIWPLIAAEPGAKSPQKAYYFYYGRQLHALRMGRYKLHLPHGYRTLAGRKGGTGGIPVKYSQARTGLALYDLEADIGEERDIKAERPEVFARMRSLANAMRQELGDARKRGSGQRRPGRIRGD